MAKLKKFEIWSAVGAIIFGSLLHFVFGWSGNWHPAALIAAVNESTWEHLKLAFWPAFIFAIVGYYTVGNPPAGGNKNFCFAQMKKLFAMPILIVILFYGWLAFFPDNFIYDISIFMIAVIIGHIVAWKLENDKLPPCKSVSAIMITLLLVAFSLFTYFPPKNFLFRDPVGGGYGIEK